MFNQPSRRRHCPLRVVGVCPRFMNAMQSQPRVRRFALLQRKDAAEDDSGWFFGPIPSRRSLRIAIEAVLWTLVAAVVQSVLIVLPGRAKVGFAQVYWTGICMMLGMKIRVIGQAALPHGGRPVVYVSNHSSWVDIPVLGARLGASFIAKQEVGTWPVISQIARLGRTVYVRRSRASTARERDEMRDRLAAGDSLILFPEGTSSDGSRVLPFRSAFLSIAEQAVTADGKTPIIQPVSIVYDRLSGLPAGRATRPIFAWYGDMDIASHFWRLGQCTGLRVTVVLHEPMDPAAFAGRKQVSQSVWRVVAEGASTLRQNRPAAPLFYAAVPARAAAGEPAFA
jgi:1-acyl-sn-glycerol-3-phosphate acyltransferase